MKRGVGDEQGFAVIAELHAVCPERRSEERRRWAHSGAEQRVADPTGGDAAVGTGRPYDDVEGIRHVDISSLIEGQGIKPRGLDSGRGGRLCGVHENRRPTAALHAGRDVGQSGQHLDGAALPCASRCRRENSDHEPERGRTNFESGDRVDVQEHAGPEVTN
jgi:hypothetical protein